MPAVSIDVRGLEQVMASFALYQDESTEPIYWQLLEAGNKIPKYSCIIADPNLSEAKLREFLTVFQQGGTKATFTIRFYNLLDKRGNIDISTPYSASFNFVLNDISTAVPYNAIAGGVTTDYRMPQQNDVLANAILELNKSVQELKEQSLSGIGQPESWQDKLYDFLANTTPGNALVSGVTDKVLDMFWKKPTTAKPVGMAGVNDSRTPEEKINDACTRLYTVDKDFADHLQMLAHVAESDWDLYETGISKLKKYSS